MGRNCLHCCMPVSTLYLARIKRRIYYAHLLRALKLRLRLCLREFNRLCVPIAAHGSAPPLGPLARETSTCRSRPPPVGYCAAIGSLPARAPARLPTASIGTRTCLNP